MTVTLTNIVADKNIARLVVACLHQAVAECLPTRLEFYETWLDTRKLRRESVGPVQVTAVLSFLRQEDEAYDAVVARAGTYAVNWTLEVWPSPLISTINALPSFARLRVVLRLAARLLRTLGVVGRVTIRSRQGIVDVEIDDSLFCEVRTRADRSLCAFHRAALQQLCDRFALPAEIELSECRAVAGTACRLRVHTRLPR